MRRIPTATILALAASLVLPAGASACSCVVPDIDRDLPRADGAVVGTVIGSRVAPTERRRVTTIEVEHVAKGAIGDTVDVHGNVDSAACGLTMPEGQRVGLLLSRAPGGTWSSSLCQVVDADELAAIEPSGSTQERPRSSGGSLLERLLAALARLCRGG